MNYVVTTRTNRHSQKPQLVRRIIERCGHSPRLELFARTSTSHWHAWGSELTTAADPTA